MESKWNLRNIIIMTLIAVLCGIIFWGTSFIYSLLSLALAPFGLQPLANDATIGIWCLAGPLTIEIFRFPGAALFSETIAAVIETFMGGQWGIIEIIEGLIQGCGTEAGFALTGYRNYGKLGITLSVITGTGITFGWDCIKNGYAHYSILLLATLFITRLISFAIFSGWLPEIVVKLLEKSHALDLIRKS